jgi:hypothetical protein
VQARSTKLYQAFFLVTFVFLPAYAVGHLDRVVLNQAVIWNEKAGAANAIAVKYSVFEGNPDEQRRAAATLSPDSAGEHPQLWLADRFYDPQREQDVNFKTNNPRDLSPPCEEHRRACRGVQWFHPGSLIALAVMSGLAGAIVLFLLFTLFRPSGAGQT